MAEGSRGGVLAGRIRCGQTRRRGGPRGLGGGRRFGLGLSSRPSAPRSSAAAVDPPRSAAVASQVEPGAALPAAEAAPYPAAPIGQPVATEPPPAAAVAPQPDDQVSLLQPRRPVAAPIYSAADPDVVPPRSIGLVRQQPRERRGRDWRTLPWKSKSWSRPRARLNRSG